MDIDTVEVIEGLRADIRQVKTEVGHVRTEVVRVEQTLTAKMHELSDDTRRHANIQFESVRDDLRMVAEHLVALGSKVDSLRR